MKEPTVPPTDHTPPTGPVYRRVPVADIKPGPRERLRDIDKLAASMAEVGQLQPIGLSTANELRFGGRRLAAAKSLGWETVAALVFDSLDEALPALRAELAENEVRDAFTPSERASLGAAIEEAEREEARRRQQEGGRVGGQASGTGSGSLPKANKGDTRDKVGEAVGLSGKSYEQAKKVSGSE